MRWGDSHIDGSPLQYDSGINRITEEVRECPVGKRLTNSADILCKCVPELL
jgi:hypothetical protein